MPSLAELTNLSQTRYNPTISGGAGVPQANVGLVQPKNISVTGEKNLDRLATDISKLVTGIETYGQKKYDLTVDATKKMASDHLATLEEQTTYIYANKDLDYEQRREQIKSLRQDFLTKSSAFINEDENLKNIYNESFSNPSKKYLSKVLTKIDDEERDYNITVKVNAANDTLINSPVTAKYDDYVDAYKEMIADGTTTEETVKSNFIKTKLESIENSYKADRYNFFDKNGNFDEDSFSQYFSEDMANDDRVKLFKNSLLSTEKDRIKKDIDERNTAYMNSVYESYSQDSTLSNKKVLISNVKASQIEGHQKVTLLNMLGAFSSGTSSSDMSKSVNVSIKELQIKSNEPISKKQSLAKDNQNVIKTLEDLKNSVNNSSVDKTTKTDLTIKLDNAIEEKIQLEKVIEAVSNGNSIYTKEGSEGRAYINGLVTNQEQGLMKAIAENDNNAVNNTVASLLRLTSRAKGVTSPELDKIDGRFLNASYSFNNAKDAQTFITVANAVSNSGTQTLHKSINDKQLINKLNSLDPQDDKYLERFNQIRTSWQVANSKITVKGSDNDVTAEKIIDKVSNDLWLRLDMDLPRSYSKMLITKELEKRGVENPLTEDEAIDLLESNFVTYSGDTQPDSSFVGKAREVAYSVWNTFTDSSISLPKGLGGETDEKIINDIFSGFLAEKQLSPYDVRVETYIGKDGLPVIWVINKETGFEYGSIDKSNSDKYYSNYQSFKEGE